MKTVYFVRHGQSEGNVSDTIFGETSPLTAKGQEQAEFIAERASKLPIDVIISSTFPRARETAARISKRTGKPVEESDLFVERLWPRSAIGKKKSNPEVHAFLRRWYASFYGDERVEDGENFADIKERAAKAIKFLESRPEQHVLVTTHGFFLRVILGLALLGDTLTPQEFFKVAQTVRTENTGLSVLEHYAEETQQFDGYPFTGWRVRVWNDHAHLG